MPIADLPKIKQRLWLMRNGIVSDALRQAGAPFEIVLGVNLPQMVQIAAYYAADAEVARQLWRADKVREHHLIAPLLFPLDELTAAEALQLMATAQTIEGADILCHRLLRHAPFAADVAATAWQQPQNDMQAYAALRLARNLQAAEAFNPGPLSAMATDMARHAQNRNFSAPFAKSIANLATQILEEL